MNSIPLVVLGLWHFTNPKWHGAPHPLVSWLRGRFDMQCPLISGEGGLHSGRVPPTFQGCTARTRISGRIFLVPQGWAVLQIHLSFIATVHLRTSTVAMARGRRSDAQAPRGPGQGIQPFQRQIRCLGGYLRCRMKQTSFWAFHHCLPLDGFHAKE